MLRKDQFASGWKPFLLISSVVLLFEASASLFFMQGHWFTKEGLANGVEIVAPVSLLISVFNIRLGAGLLWCIFVVVHFLVSAAGWPHWYAPLFALQADWWLLCIALGLQWFASTGKGTAVKAL